MIVNQNGPLRDNQIRDDQPDVDQPGVDQAQTQPEDNEPKKGSCLKRFLILGLTLAVILDITFIILDATAIHGPCMSSLLEGGGSSERLIIEHLEYRMVPEQNEIVMSWTESTYPENRLFRSGHPAKPTKSESFIRHIPLDPLPPDLTRCYVDVTVSEDAPMPPTVKFSEMNPMPEFRGEPVSRPGWNNPFVTKEELRRNFPQDMVFHIEVPSKALVDLDHEFMLKVTFLQPPLYGFDYAGREMYSTVMMFPYAVEEDGRRVMYLTGNNGERLLYGDDLNRRIQEHRESPVTIRGTAARLLLMPFAAVGDMAVGIAMILWLIAHPF